MGSSPNAAAAAASWPPHPAAQGIVQMIGVFIDTIVICTASAIIVMLAPRPPTMNIRSTVFRTCNTR
ncbi:alanine:cation symporter family protein [Klebsiella pneumoniae]|nr:alanine:cation symporter family protein [Klebsiella pneumoniae]